GGVAAPAWMNAARLFGGHGSAVEPAVEIRRRDEGRHARMNGRQSSIGVGRDNGGGGRALAIGAGPDMTHTSHVNDLSARTFDSDALSGKGNLYPAPHLFPCSNCANKKRAVVYFASIGGLVKIGHSGNVKKRLYT